MTLGFSTKIKGKPTQFCEKIWQSFSDDFTHNHFTDYCDGFDKVGYQWNVNAIDLLPKRHSLREDVHDKWKAGNNIHFVINNRTPIRFQFAPVIPCISTQEIQIIHGLKRDKQAFVSVNGKVLRVSQIEELAMNDGFDSIQDFFSWFNQDFNGKIIHWTNLKY